MFMCWGLAALFRCLGVEMLNCLSSQRTTDKQLNRPEASTPNNDHVPGVGANCIRPIRRPPMGPNEYVWRPSLPGRLEGVCNTPLHRRREMTLAAGFKSVFGPK